jgi:hypothetical protein
VTGKLGQPSAKTNLDGPSLAWKICTKAVSPPASSTVRLSVCARDRNLDALRLYQPR